MFERSSDKSLSLAYSNYRGAGWAFTRSNDSWKQQGEKFVGSGAIENSQHASVSITADGNTAVIGGPSYDGGKGVVWVFTRAAGVWKEQSRLSVSSGAPGDYLGRSVAISADGSTIVAGGGNNGSNVGGVWVFTRTSSSWIQQGGKLVGSGAVGNATQGQTIAISADGNTFVTGGISDNSYTGAAWIFTRANGTWTQQGSKLVGTGFIGETRQGSAVSISADGNTVAIGGQLDNVGTGATWIFTRTNSTWVQQGNKLVATGGAMISNQGSAVALSGDGNTLVIGATIDNGSKGALWVYTRKDAVWTQDGEKLVPTDVSGWAPGVGYSIAISSNASTIAVGGPGEPQYGAVWIFTR